MRILYYIPVIHFNRKRLAGDSDGMDADALYSTLGSFWGLVEKHVSGLELSPPRTVIYQDSFPARDRTSAMALLEENVRSGSPQAHIVLGLARYGARIEKTDSVPRLLFHLACLHSPRIPGLGLLGNAAMRLRERYMASRINKTLKEGDIGILFSGAALRRFRKHLAPDIVVWQRFDPLRALTAAARETDGFNSPMVCQMLEYLEALEH